MIKAIVFTILVSLNIFSAKGNDTIPEMNRTIVEYVNSVMGTQVDRGECWDLAYQALNKVGATWDGEYKYGKVVDYLKETVYPGDIVHFKNVVIKQTEGLTTTTQTMGQHTAIILKVYAVGVYELAHQNTGFSGRKVGTSPIDLNGRVKGKVTIYRPTK
ncbi:MAG: hypothetical protein PHD06_06775 [Bacteroidales bacterium]|nr:hypothetical protein [Bacteroidales bacterium]MDD4384865.1 hypothetical protein [Bacteroidales bacterium]